MSRKKQWGDFSGRQQAAMVALGAVELVLTARAATDLYRRPRESVRGPKALWWPTLVVQPFGPIAYLLLGRR